jgi:tetratricopeptide (TPR) repeat protein
MSLASSFESQRRAIRAFYDDPAAGSMFVLAAPEAEGLAAKLIASVEAEKTSREVTFAYSGPFVTAASYYAAAAQSILDNLTEHADALKEDRIDLDLPWPWDAEFSAASDELLFADFVERVSRALDPELARRTVVLLRAEPVPEPPPHASDAPDFIASVSQLGALIAPERTKFVLFVDPTFICPEHASAAERLRVVAPKNAKKKLSALHGFFAGSARRVLVLHSPEDPLETELGPFQSLAFDAGYHARFLSITLKPAPLALMAEQAIAALRALAEQHRVPLPVDKKLLAPIDRLAQLCEEWARSPKESYQQCLVVLRLADWGERDVSLGRALVLALNRAACSVRVRYLVLDDTRAGIFPVLEEAPRRVATLRVAPDSGAMESGLQAKLNEPALPVPERIQCLVSLAALASARKDHTTALALHDQALVLSQGSDDPTGSFLVWLGIGQTFYRSAAWESAEGAFSKALDISLNAQLAPGIAQSTLSLADTLLCAERLDDAAACYQSAVDWYDKLAVPLFACHALTWLGETQRRAKALDVALATWNSTLERYAALGPDLDAAKREGEKQVLGRLVRLDEERHDSAAAKRHQDALSALGPAPILSEVP